MAPAVVSLGEVVDAGGVYGPVVALAVLRATGLDEALVETEVVADAVAPGALLVVVEGEAVHDELVDVAQNEFLLVALEDRHRDEGDVRVRRFLVRC